MIQRSDDEIYRVPEELKVTTVATTKTIRGHEEEVVSTWSTGIAEVALPLSFKMKNIIDTGAAVRRKQEQEGLDKPTKSNNFNGYQRFHLHDNSLTKLSSSLHESPSALLACTDHAFLAQLAQAQEHFEKEKVRKSSAKSTDDRALQRFKQVCIFF